jgi:hypothetical protein
LILPRSCIKQRPITSSSSFLILIYIPLISLFYLPSDHA